MFYNSEVLNRFILLILFLAAAPGFAQESALKQPQVKINYLNVCTPSDAEKQELSAALSRIPLHPQFARDFEISRGRSTPVSAEAALSPITGQSGSADPADAGGISNWVRVRREFPAQSPFSSVQYSMSVDQKNVIETLVFTLREMKNVIQVSMEDTVSAGASPLQALKADTPVDRVRIERFGKSSVALAHCPTADQKNYQPLFDLASATLSRYRAVLRVRSTVPEDLKRLGIGTGQTPALRSNRNSR